MADPEQPGLAAEGLEEDRSVEGLEDNVTLSFLDKLKCMMYSKVERDAFLIEKLEKEEKKKARQLEGLKETKEKEKKKKTTVFDKLKSVFATPEEQHEFLQRQVDEVKRTSKRHSPDEEHPVPREGAAAP